MHGFRTYSKLSKGQSPTWTFLIKICYSLVQTIFSIISIASIDIVFSLMQRPYEIHASTSLSDVQHIFTSESVHYPTSWSRDMVHVLQRVRKSLAVKCFKSILIYSNNLWLSALFKIKSLFKDFIFSYFSLRCLDNGHFLLIWHQQISFKFCPVDTMTPLILNYTIHTYTIY